MSNKELIINSFSKLLKEKIVQYFENSKTFRNRAILNSEKVLESAYKKEELCSEIVFYNLKDLPLAKIMLGDCNEVSLLEHLPIQFEYF